METKKKEKPIIGKIVKITPGKRHAWYESSVGVIRKELGKV